MGVLSIGESEILFFKFNYKNKKNAKMCERVYFPVQFPD